MRFSLLTLLCAQRKAIFFTYYINIVRPDNFDHSITKLKIIFYIYLLIFHFYNNPCTLEIKMEKLATKLIE